MRAVLAMLRTDLAGEGRRLALLILVALIATTLEGGGLLILAALLRVLAPAGAMAGELDQDRALYLALGLAGLAVIAALAGRMRLTLATRLRLAAVARLRLRLYTAMFAQSWPALRDLDAADMVHVLNVEAARAGFGVEFCLRAVSWAVGLPVLVLVAARLSPPLTLAVLAAGAVLIPLALWSERATRRRAAAALAAARAFTQTAADDLAARREIRQFDLGAPRAARFAARLRDAHAAQLAQIRLIGDRQAVSQALAAWVSAAGLALAVTEGGMALTDALVFALTFARLAQILLRCLDAGRQAVAVLPAWQASAALMDRCAAAAEARGADPPRPRAVITLEALGQPGTCLNGLSAELPLGRRILIRGPSGAGKTTLLDLLAGLYPPAAGRILIDGRALTPADLPGWRRWVAVMPQMPVLPRGTLGAALAEIAPAADAPQIWAALDAAAAGDWVRGLPDGLATPVRPDFSGGERQRLTLARALLRSAPILILDEPTAALDDAAEARILAALAARTPVQTVILASHRPAAAAWAELIIDLPVELSAGAPASQSADRRWHPDQP